MFRNKFYRQLLIFLVIYIVCFLIIFLIINLQFKAHDTFVSREWTFLWLPLKTHEVIETENGYIFRSPYRYGLYILPFICSFVLTGINYVFSEVLKKKLMSECDE